MKSQIQVSVVIPTYNRRNSLLRTLNSLYTQTLSPECYEVIVVDDGSNYDADEITELDRPFAIEYLRQSNQGATIARNHGAQKSKGAVIVFIDDDVTVSSETLEALGKACMHENCIIGMGRLFPRSDAKGSLYARADIADQIRNNPGNVNAMIDIDMHFANCNTQLLAVRREDFFNLGMLQDPTGGWPNWDDVDFGFRAHLAGFRLRQCAKAIGEHWDHSLADLKVACRRWHRASTAAVLLFNKYPELQQYIPMYHDKTPIMWGKDPSRLIFRKIVRQMVSSRLFLYSMELIASSLEISEFTYPALRPLYRWIKGGYMYRGFREGLHK